MDQKLTQILLFFGLCIPSSYQIRQFHYVNLEMNWTNAQTYCREKYTDLATIESMEHIKRLRRPSLNKTTSWIGLRDDSNAWRGTLKHYINSWKWSATGESKTGYASWDFKQPDNWMSSENCVMMFPTGDWCDVKCSLLNPFLCYTETADKNKIFVYVELLLTWLDAQAYCRAHYTDLATIETFEENTEAFQAKSLWISAWIGLYRTPWTWSDNSNSLFRNWRLGEPNNDGGNEFCVFENSNHEWGDGGCHMNKTFICYEDVVVQTTVVKIKTHTDADLTDPAINTQVLQELSTRLRGEGLTDIKLQWKLQPRKQEMNNFTQSSSISYC